MNGRFYDVTGGRWEDIGGGRKRKIIHMGNMTVMALRAPKGTVTDAKHKHPNEQAAVVFSGRVRMFLGAESRVIGAGEGYLVPPDVEHHIEALEDTVLIDYFTPKRSDLTATE
jgi:quercetin dioxygenase-like cupin family protein